MKSSPFIVAAALALVASAAAAQERIGSSAPEPAYHAGWTLTPSFGVAETYDDNVSLFGRGSAEDQNNDVVATYFPELDLHYAGRHTVFGTGYTGSFLSYRTFSGLNRWDQRGRLEIRREETARLKWFAHANAAAVPSTDLIDLGGIPFRRTGATTADGRTGVEYVLSATDAISSTADYQSVQFDRTDNIYELRGGNVLESLTGWRHKVSPRTAVGADYSFRRANVVGETDTFNLHATQAALDYEISPLWTLSAGGGAVYMQATPRFEGRTGPAYRISLDRHRAGRTFHVGYLRSYIPSFGFGGTIQNQQASIGFRTPLFASRHFYLDGSAVFRDDQPLTDATQQLPLRSFRTYAIVGWAPEEWVRLEAFYARVDQTSTRPGGELFRNRVGFQIVTSKPMRMQ